MAFHIISPRVVDIDDPALFETGRGQPRHALAMLARELGATLHAPGEEAPPSIGDRMRG